MKPVRIYITCNQMVRTQQSLNLLLNRIKASKLAQCEIHLLHSKDWPIIEDFLGLNVRLRNTGYTADHYEFPALAQIRLDSQQHSFYGLYLHCKGSSQADESLWQNSVAWADYMLAGVVDHSEQCLHHLQSGAELVGSQWHWHFKGNFYWFDSDYVQQLVDPMIMDLDYRLNCEFWCSYSYWWGRYPLPKIKNLFYVPIQNDSDYITQYRNNFVPPINKPYIRAGKFAEFLETYWAGAFDVICVNSKEFDAFQDRFIKYLNYDAMVVNVDSGQIYEANYFLHRN